MILPKPMRNALCLQAGDTLELNVQGDNNSPDKISAKCVAEHTFALAGVSRA